MKITTNKFSYPNGERAISNDNARWQHQMTTQITTQMTTPDVNFYDIPDENTNWLLI
jgi:hypothetical protein